jgi:Rod binding domain-containing protein
MSYLGVNNLAMQPINPAIPTINRAVSNDKLKEQTDNYEAVILKMLMDNAMKDENNIFSAQKDPGEKIYKDMYRDELSKASAGGFGFSKMLYDYLSAKK